MRVSSQSCCSLTSSHGVYVFALVAFFEAGAEPVLDDLEVFGFAGHLVVLPDAVETDAVGPFPVVPAFCVDDLAVGEGHEEFAGCVFDVDEFVDELLDLGVDVLRRDGVDVSRHDGGSQCMVTLVN
ncbi:hypothetical protein HG531_002720 [Fusarium graminearum]|nr:hypothetical protein HG531_002720 [Fusarium graminearum]